MAQASKTAADFPAQKPLFFEVIRDLSEAIETKKTEDEARHLGSLKKLILNKHDVNLCSEGITPLELAASKNCQSAIKLLVEGRAEITSSILPRILEVAKKDDGLIIAYLLDKMAGNESHLPQIIKKVNEVFPHLNKRLAKKIFNGIFPGKARLHIYNEDDFDRILTFLKNISLEDFETCWSHLDENAQANYKLLFTTILAQISHLSYTTYHQELVEHILKLPIKDLDVNAPIATFLEAFNPNQPAEIITLVEAVACSNNLMAQQLLADPRINPNAVDGFGRTALIVAIHQGNLEMVKLLASKGVDFTQKREFWFKQKSFRKPSGDAVFSFTPIEYARKVAAGAKETSEWEGRKAIVQLIEEMQKKQQRMDAPRATIAASASATAGSITAVTSASSPLVSAVPGLAGQGLTLSDSKSINSNLYDPRLFSRTSLPTDLPADPKSQRIAELEALVAAQRQQIEQLKQALAQYEQAQPSASWKPQ